jgi:hypothetical protein
MQSQMMLYLYGLILSHDRHVGIIMAGNLKKYNGTGDHVWHHNHTNLHENLWVG